MIQENTISTVYPFYRRFFDFSKTIDLDKGTFNSSMILHERKRNQRAKNRKRNKKW